MAGWHHRLNGHEFEQAPGVGDGQGSLACCSPWGRKELDMIVTKLIKQTYLVSQTSSTLSDLYVIQKLSLLYASVSLYLERYLSLAAF